MNELNELWAHRDLATAANGQTANLLDYLSSLHHYLYILNDQFTGHLKALQILLISAPGRQDVPLPSALPLYATYLGRFTLHRGQASVALGRNKAVHELCRYLIARAGEMVSRDELLELLWPEASPSRTSHRLHVAISSLRQLLDSGDEAGSYIQHEDDHYCIPAHTVLTDCYFFDMYYGEAKERLAHGDYASAARTFRAALSLYQGDYLSDHIYADRTHLKRAHYAERRLNALTMLGEYSLREGRLAAVADYAQQILTADALQERAHRWLMRTYYLTGQRACAIRQYRTCNTALERELGVTPSQQTEALYQAICHDTPLPDDLLLYPYPLR